jgi:membrane protein CcdC involved in cytochrome C biogenesis
MHIIVIAWVYIVLIMSISNGIDYSVFAGIMTFLGYCVLPLSVFLYIASSRKRKKKRDAELWAAHLKRKEEEAALTGEAQPIEKLD